MILVTGASGFVGSHLVKHLTDKGEKVISHIHDIKSSNWLRDALNQSIKVRGDIRDFHFLKRVLNQYSISKVYHLAAQSIVKHAWKDPINTVDINVLGTVKLLEACRQLEVKTIVFQSTDKVYGNQIEAKVTDSLKPTEPYGSSKISADIMAQTFAKTYGMNITVCRCCNIYGFDWNNRIIPNTIRACLRKESPIIFKNDDSKRQYIYIHDAVKALEFLATNPKSDGNIFNIGTKDVLNQEEVVLKILNFFPFLKPRYIEKPSLVQIKSQSMKVNMPSGWKPEITFKQGIKLTIDAFRKYSF